MVRTKFAVSSYRVQEGPLSMATLSIQARQTNAKSQCNSYTIHSRQNDIRANVS